MSQTDTFMDEVAEEVRRDKMYGWAKRYGWMVALVILLIVGGTAWREISASRSEAAAAARGDALYAALELEDGAARAEALDLAAEDAATTGVVTRMLAATETARAGDVQTAAELYSAIASTPDVNPIYRDMALLKRAMLPGGDADRAGTLQSLALPGAPYRTLAEEQLAILDVEAGDIDAALARLQPLLEDAETTQNQQRRIIQLIVALGGTPELASETPAVTNN